MILRILIVWLLIAVPAFAQGSGSVAVVPNVAALTNRPPSAINPVVSLSGFRTNGDFGPERTIRYVPTSTNAVDNGCVFSTSTGIGRWEAPDCDGAFVNVRWYGATGNGTSNDTAAITAAAAKVQSKGGGTLLYPIGTYLVSKIGPVAHFANITNVSISAENAVFTEADYVDSTWTSVTLTNLGTVATAIWASPHGFSPGSLFLVKDSTDVAFDGYWTVTHVDSPTKIRFNLTSYNVPAGAATALAHVSDTSHVLFRFDSCTNVNLGKIVFRGHALPVDNQFRLGWRVVEVFRGTKGVRGELDVEGAAYGFYSGEYNVQSISGCSDLRIKVVAKNVGYPVQATGLDDSAFEIVCDTVHRAGYFGGVRRSSAHIWAKNWDIVGALLTHQPDPVDSRGCEDFTLRVWDTGTTVPQKLLAYGGYRHMASVAGYANTNAVKHRNLDIRVYGKNIPRGAGLIVQTYGTNHWIDGLKFGGNIDQSGLNSTNTGWPFFIYDTSTTTAGHYKDLVIEDFTWKSTTNSGSYPGFIRLAQAENDVEFNRYSTDIYTSQALPDGIHAVTVPRFPDWTAGSFEAAQIQGIKGGIKLAETTAIVPLASSLGSNDFTVQWVGDVPTGNAGLFAITTGSSAGAGSFGASINNGDLIVRAYGTSAADWVGVTATNWASALRGKVTSLGIVKTATGVSIWTDGHSTAGTVITNGIPPTWSDALAGTNAYIGTDDSGSKYTGTVYRFAVFNYDRGSEFPDLAVRWNPGSSSSASGTSTIDEATGNGGFETLGTGGTDPFGSWTESADGSSAVTVSTNAVQGTNSLALSVDGSDSFAGVTSSETLVNGATYQITFWARVLNGTSGQIAIVGAAGGDYPITITGTWAKYSVELLWNSTSFNLKRWSLTSQTAEIDAITVQRVGALCDFDWTSSPADRVSGTFASPLGGSSTKVISRGLGISPDRGDNSANIEAGHDAPVQVWASNLTGARTANLQTNHARRGDVFRIVRKDSGSGSLTLSTSPAVAVRTNHWVDVVFDGALWSPSGYGSLSAGSGSGWDSDALDGQDGSWYLDRANHTGTQSYTTISGLGGLATVNDAPSDGTTYGRQNGAWASVAGSGGGLGTNAFVNGALRQPFRLTNDPVASGGVIFITNGAGEVTAYATNLPAGGGSGLGTNAFVNGALRQPFRLTNDPVASGGVIFITNGAGEVTAYATNLPAGGGSGLGTNAFVNGVLRQPFRLTNDPVASGGVIFITNGAGEVTAYATNLPAAGSGQGTNAFVNGVLRQPFRLTNDPVASGGVIFITNGAGEVTAYATNLPAGGGGGLGTNAFVNGVLRQPFKLTNDPVASGGVIFITNGAGEVTAYATNLPAGGGGGLGTNAFVNGVLRQPFKLTNDTASVGGIVWTTNANGDVKAQATNLPTVTNSPVTGLWQTLGSADIVVVDTGNTSSSATFTNFSGVVNEMTVLEPDGSDYRLQIELTFNEDIGTNYLVLFDFDGSDNEDSAYGLQAWVQTSSRTGTGCDVSIADSDGFVYDYDGYKIRIRIVNPNATAGGEGGDVLTTADNVLSGVNQFTNGLGQVFSVPPRVLGGRINGWTASQMTPGTNATTQAQYKVLGDGIPSIEFDGATSEEISMVGLLSQDPDRGSFVTITFASDDTANTVCWQAQWQLLTLRGIDTNLLSTAATWTSNIPGTARVPTNITFSLNAPTGLVGSTNDFSKPYMLRVTRLPGSDSSLSNAYLIGVDHRYGR